MKSRLVRLILITFGIVCIIYYLLLAFVVKDYAQFAFIWLVIGAVFILGAFIKLGRFRCIFRVLFALFIVNMAFNLCFIICVKSISTPPNVSYIIVLGGGITKDKTLPSTPLMRIKKAAIYLKSHPTCRVVVTGGHLPHTPCDEASIMKEKLVKMGIDSSRILIEDKAQDTIQNLYYSLHIIAKDSNKTTSEVLKMPIIIITSRFHLSRSLAIAKSYNYTNVIGLATPVASLCIPNVYFREMCAVNKFLFWKIFLNKSVNF